MPARGPARFPNPRNTGPEGIVCFGANLKPETLLEAYREGIFPWPVEGLPLAWFCPPERGILEFDRLHIPRSLARLRKKNPFRLTFDTAFDDVIEACADITRKGQDGTWITEPMELAYKRLHRLGHAHSVEAWDGDRLVGGIYGVDAGGAFSGESMFHLETGASKLALLHLVDWLRGRGLEWMDIQMLTPHLAALGARLIPRDDFLTRLARTLARPARLFGE
jgi:leucyl/phenylalanyl-tRNA--protein transferase